jgi:hypothetical protein
VLPWFLPIFRLDAACPEEKLPRRVPVVPLTAVGVDKTGPSSLPNQTVQFFLFQVGAFSSCPIHVATEFGDSAGESIFSSHDSLWDGGLQQHHHAIHLYQPRVTTHKLFA